jgi:YD repeat-containing protein
VRFTGPVRGQIQRVFDADFRVVGHKVNGQLVASYGFDGDGLLVQAGDLALSRDSQTGFVVASRAGVVEEARGYNGFGELAEQVWRASGVPILVVRFQRDGLGRVVGKEEEQGGQRTRWEYGYDGAGRLVLERKILPDGSVLESQWSYDANGNRLSERKPDGSLLTASYDAQDRILSYGDFTFTHSHNGELLSKCQGSFCRSFVYDVFGNLRQVVMESGQVIEYLVDGRNRRVGKRVDGVLVQGFLYDDQLRILAELDGGSNVVATFVYGEGINVPELMVKGGRTYRLVKDQLGSVRLVVDTADGSIVQEMRYDAWGNVVLDTNPGFQPFGFAGGLYDPQTRLVRFGARDFDASIGRWMGVAGIPRLVAGRGGPRKKGGGAAGGDAGGSRPAPGVAGSGAVTGVRVRGR